MRSSSLNPRELIFSSTLRRKFSSPLYRVTGYVSSMSPILALLHSPEMRSSLDVSWTCMLSAWRPYRVPKPSRNHAITRRQHTSNETLHQPNSTRLAIEHFSSIQTRHLHAIENGPPRNLPRSQGRFREQSPSA